jgi:hypothetical protein
MSSRGLSPGPIHQRAPKRHRALSASTGSPRHLALLARWIPGTSPGMTAQGARETREDCNEARHWRPARTEGTALVSATIPPPLTPPREGEGNSVGDGRERRSNFALSPDANTTGRPGLQTAHHPSEPSPLPLTGSGRGWGERLTLMLTNSHHHSTAWRFSNLRHRSRASIGRA